MNQLHIRDTCSRHAIRAGITTPADKPETNYREAVGQSTRQRTMGTQNEDMKYPRNPWWDHPCQLGLRKAFASLWPRRLRPGRSPGRGLGLGLGLGLAEEDPKGKSWKSQVQKNLIKGRIYDSPSEARIYLGLRGHGSCHPQHEAHCPLIHATFLGQHLSHDLNPKP